MEFIYSCLSCFLLFLLLPSNFAFIILYSFLKKKKKALQIIQVSCPPKRRGSVCTYTAGRRRKVSGYRQLTLLWDRKRQHHPFPSAGHSGYRWSGHPTGTIWRKKAWYCGRFCFIYLFISLAVPGLTCGTRNLLTVACGI